MAKSNVILVKLEDSDSVFPPPLGILYVAGALKKSKFSVEIFHKMGTGDNIKLLLKKIKREKPLFVGFSLYTAMGFLETIEASKYIKKHSPETIIVWGGVHPTILPVDSLKYDYVDIAVIGEGEVTIQELAKALKNKKSLGQVKGIGFKQKGKIKINPGREFIKNLDDFSPAWDLIDLNNYLHKEIAFAGKKTMTLLTSRGCPFRCGFCYNLAVYKRKWRAHSPEFVLKQFKKLIKKYEIEAVTFHDDNFFVNKDRAIKILKGINLPFFAEMRADAADEKFIKKLAEHKCNMLFIGAESGSERVLRDLVKKDLGKDDIVRIVKYCKKYGIKVSLSFIAGFPGEKEGEMYKTLDFMLEIQKIHPSSNIEVKIYTPYPETPLWEESLKNGLLMPKNQEDWANFKRKRCNLPWIKDEKRLENMIDVINVAITTGRKREGILGLLVILSLIERLRVRYRFFKFPLEVKLFLFAKEKIKNRVNPPTRI